MSPTLVRYLLLVAVVFIGFSQAAWPFGSQPQTTSSPMPCPSPPFCPLNGTWIGERGALNLQVISKPKQPMHVKYTLRGMVLQGVLQFPYNSTVVPTSAQVLLATNSTPITCLMAVLTCHQRHLWVTEMPLMGNSAAVTYPLRPHVPVQEKPQVNKNAANKNSEKLQEIVIQIALGKNFTDDDPYGYYWLPE
ncbi:hypothetical protein Pmani_040267 [Petrolisthes manimaculis]|uniref:Uncharacterized protein n=1 Tax=Petrolisthes manimaculis TaxID=1843537 RepID=A0AAE1NCK5_9EUCA|nr:hypothetical protein Pmani_040267 [Petrolisthes manimaculis]